MERIDSGTNAKIKWTAALRRRRERERSGAFVAEGARLAEEAASSGWPVLFCLVTEKALARARVERLAASLETRGCPVYLTADAAYRKAAATVEPQGVLLVVKRRTAALSELSSKEAPLLAVLDGVQDPGNAGTILRMADAAGCTGAAATEGSVDLFSEKAVRASMGSLFHLPVAARVTGEAFAAYAEERGIALFTAALDRAACPHFDADYREPAAIVFGNEGGGASPPLLRRAKRIYIPMAGKAESLNVSAAAAIVLYEAFRQRRFPAPQGLAARGGIALGREVP